jgi:hypothetical protein
VLYPASAQAEEFVLDCTFTAAESGIRSSSRLIVDDKGVTDISGSNRIYYTNRKNDEEEHYFRINEYELRFGFNNYRMGRFWILFSIATQAKF